MRSLAHCLLPLLMLLAGAAHAQMPPPDRPPPPNGPYGPPPGGPYGHPPPPPGFPPPPPPPPEPRVIVVQVPAATPPAQPAAAPAPAQVVAATPVAPEPVRVEAATPAPSTPDVAPAAAAPAPIAAPMPATQSVIEPTARPTQPPTPSPSQWPGRLAAALGLLALLAWLMTWLRNRGLASEAAALAHAQRELRSRHFRLREESEKLRVMATHDPLTGTLNRQAFGNELRERAAALATFAKPLSLVVFDLDHFKQINDRDGHAAGDAALRLIAGIVHECLDSDDLFGRFGGDEFLIAFCDQLPADVDAIAERIRGLVEVRALGHQPPLPGLSLSIGIAHSGQDGAHDIDLMFHRADAARYAAKRRGRNRVVVADSALDTTDAMDPLASARHL